MIRSEDIAHSVSGLVRVPAASAFAFMCDAGALGRWSLGCLNATAEAPSGLIRGTSLFDGSETRFRISADPDRLLVDYMLCADDLLLPRISARIVDARTAGLSEDHCYLTLSAWRPNAMDEARWHRLCRTHELEILLIAAHCEAAFA